MVLGLAVKLLIWSAESVNASSPSSVKIAILDSGCNSSYTEGISLIDESIRDYNGHGTLMAGIIKEVYPEARLYIIKVIGKDGLAINEEAITLGLEWAVSRGVNVINMSLRLKDSERLHEVIRKARDKGIAIVAAAGNKSTRMGLATGKGKINLNEVAYPAKYPEVIAVGALDRHGRVYDASIKGKEVEIFCKGYKGKEAGTSIASAYAAGFVAKIISENPDGNLQNIIDILHQKSERGELR